MGIGGPVFNIFKDFLSNRQQRVLVDGNFSQFKPVVSDVLEGSVWAYNSLHISYADNTTLYAEVAPLSDLIKVASSLNRYLPTIQSWCST